MNTFPMRYLYNGCLNGARYIRLKGSVFGWHILYGASKKYDSSDVYASDLIDFLNKYGIK